MLIFFNSLGGAVRILLKVVGIVSVEPSAAPKSQSIHPGDEVSPGVGELSSSMGLGEEKAEESSPGDGDSSIGIVAASLNFP